MQRVMRTGQMGQCNLMVVLFFCDFAIAEVATRDDSIQRTATVRAWANSRPPARACRAAAQLSVWYEPLSVSNAAFRRRGGAILEVLVGSPYWRATKAILGLRTQLRHVQFRAVGHRSKFLLVNSRMPPSAGVNILAPKYSFRWTRFPNWVGGERDLIRARDIQLRDMA